MKVQRFSIQTCCGKTAIIFKTDRPLSNSHITYLVANGYTEYDYHTKAGILYVDNENFILNGPIGSDRLTVKCRKQDCSDKINELELLLDKID